MIIKAINTIYALIDLNDFIVERFDEALDELYKELKKAKKK